MRKVVILTLVTLFTCVEYSQAQTTEKEMTRQEKKAAQEALDKMLFQEAKEAIDNQTNCIQEHDKQSSVQQASTPSLQRQAQARKRKLPEAQHHTSGNKPTSQHQGFIQHH